MSPKSGVLNIDASSTTIRSPVLQDLGLAGPRLLAGGPDRDLDHVLVHVDPRDALIQHLHAPGHLLQRHPPPIGTGAARQSPGSVQETDTRARSSNGGYPAWGSGSNLINGLERSMAKR